MVLVLVRRLPGVLRAEVSLVLVLRPEVWLVLLLRLRLPEVWLVLVLVLVRRLSEARLVGKIVLNDRRRRLSLPEARLVRKIVLRRNDLLQQHITIILRIKNRIDKV